MSTKKDVAEQFVQAYYTTLIQNNGSLVKFYDENAMIWRDSFGNGEGKTLEKAKADLSIKISRGSEVSVTGYSYNNFQGGIHVSVNGHILDDDLAIVFNQSFVLLEKSERYFIVSDFLKVSESEKVVESKAQTYIVQKQQQQRKTKSSGKFGVYIPGNN